MTDAAEICPGCAIVLPAARGVGHPYMTGSAACWTGFGLLLAADYADPERMTFHQLIVDAYAVQHPGGADRRQAQSVGIHLMTLALVIEDGADPALGPAFHRRMVARPGFEYLPRPASVGDLTFAHVPASGTAADARLAAFEWAASAWDAWRSHHAVVDGWLRSSGLRVSRLQ